MSAFAVVPKETNRFIAVRVWPGNEDDVESIFGDWVRKASSSFYDYVLSPADGRDSEPLSRGDWLVLTPTNQVEHYTTAEFSSRFTIMESIFNLPDPTGKQDQS